MTASLVKSLNLQIKGVCPLVRIASQIVLALELGHLKQKLGYQGGGSWQQFRDETKGGERLTWEDYCKEQAHFTSDSVENFRECAEAVKQRLGFSRKPEAKSLLAEMKIPPSESTEAQRRKLIECIVRVGLTRGDTQAYLKKEHRAAQLPAAQRKRIGKLPPPEKEGEELYQKAIRMKPIVQEEHERRYALQLQCVMNVLRNPAVRASLRKGLEP